MAHPKLATVLAYDVAPTAPSFINAQFIFGVIVFVGIVLAAVGIIQLMNKAHDKKTGKVATGILNYVIVFAGLALIIGGGIFTLASKGSGDLLNVGN